MHRDIGKTSRQLLSPWRMLLFCAMSLLGMGGCDSSDSLIQQAEEDAVVAVPAEDPHMAEAYGKARNTLDAFLAEVANPRPGSSDFAVKVAVTEGENSEYFWISPFAHAGGGFSGTINNEPRLVTSVALGDELSFDREQIVDWTYINDGGMQGNFTACALLQREPEAQRRAFMEQYSLSCDF